MRKDFGAKPWLFPMPVLIIGTYDKSGNPDAMNAAWGGISDDTQIGICLGASHKTVDNIKATGCFTVSPATKQTVVAADYVGVVSANNTPDKILKSGLTAVKSPNVNAPYFEQLPFTIECKLISYDAQSCHLFGEIVNVFGDESILTDGKPDFRKLQPVMFDPVNHYYYSGVEISGKAFDEGKKLK